MACTRPIPAARKQGGGITFLKRDAWGDQLLELPCTKCAGCRADAAQDWATRCTHEASLHTHEDGSSNNAFVTLTFSDEGLEEREKKEGTNRDSLAVRDWQLFAKRLRKEVGPFRFLMSAEYGEGEKRRPHYHALIFGQDFSEDRTLWKRKAGRSYFKSPTLEKCWGQGFHDLQQMVPAHINYVCQYVRKKLGGKPSEDSLKRWDPRTGAEISVLAPFALMSRGGKNGEGIGSAWFKKYGNDAFPSDFLVDQAGTKTRVPRYYLSRLKAVNPDAALKVRAKRQKKAQEGEKKEERSKYKKNRDREVVQEAKRQLYKRTQPNHIE